MFRTKSYVIKKCLLVLVMGRVAYFTYTPVAVSCTLETQKPVGKDGYFVGIIIAELRYYLKIYQPRNKTKFLLQHE